MIDIINPKVVDNIATADLKIHSGCCKTTLHVMAIYKDGVFSDVHNIDTGVSIYINVQNDLVKKWLEYVKENKIN